MSIVANYLSSCYTNWDCGVKSKIMKFLCGPLQLHIEHVRTFTSRLRRSASAVINLCYNNLIVMVSAAKRIQESSPPSVCNHDLGIITCYQFPQSKQVNHEKEAPISDKVTDSEEQIVSEELVPVVGIQGQVAVHKLSTKRGLSKAASNLTIPCTLFSFSISLLPIRKRSTQIMHWFQKTMYIGSIQSKVRPDTCSHITIASYNVATQENSYHMVSQSH